MPPVGALAALVLILVQTGCGQPGERLGQCYVREGDGVFIRYTGGYPNPKNVDMRLPDADAKSFRLVADTDSGGCGVGDLYGADARRVFYRNREIPSADAPSFEVLGDGYARDAGRIYYRTTPVPGVDRASFEVLDTPRRIGFARDAKALYIRERRLSGAADAASFQVLGSPFFKDARNVYVGMRLEPVPGADPASFRVLPAAAGASFSHWAVDAQRGYYYSSSTTRLIEGVDAPSFEALNKKYARDVNRVYFEGTAIDGADPGSFHIPKRHVHHVGQDRLGRYVSGRRVE
jgi:hypothetical protein